MYIHCTFCMYAIYFVFLRTIILDGARTNLTSVCFKYLHTIEVCTIYLEGSRRCSCGIFYGNYSLTSYLEFGDFTTDLFHDSTAV